MLEERLLTNLQEAQELFAILDRNDYSNCASFLQASTAQKKSIYSVPSKGNIDLVTDVDAILTSRQTREKLQCLYEHLMLNNFCKTTVLKKNYEF